MLRFQKLLKVATGSAAVVGAAAVMTEEVRASAYHIPNEKYPFNHKGYFQSYDMAAVRRGHQVYTNICATCHSMNLLAYRNLVDVCYTEEEVRAMCEELEVQDGPNDEGEMFDRPAKLSDKWVKPYPNDEAARFANGGALPPDLSLIAKAALVARTTSSLSSLGTVRLLL